MDPDGNKSPTNVDFESKGPPKSTSVFVVNWLKENFESAETHSMPRSVAFTHYERFCKEHNLEPLNSASFGKMIRNVFPHITTRRLGTRGNSKYHYYGIKIRNNSNLLFGEPLPPPPPDPVDQGADHLDYIQFSDATFKVPETIHLAQLPELDFKLHLSSEYQELFDNFYPDLLLTMQNYLNSMLGFDLPSCKRHFQTLNSQTFVTLLNSDDFVNLFFIVKDICYQTLLHCFLPSIFEGIDANTSQYLNKLIKGLEICELFETGSLPQAFLTQNQLHIHRFMHKLRLLLSLNTLVSTVNQVLNTPAFITSMIEDVNQTDFELLDTKAQLLFGSPLEFLPEFINDLTQGLLKPFTVSEWLNHLIFIFEKYDITKITFEERCSVLRGFCTYNSLFANNLTILNAASFGSFQVLRALFEDFFEFYIAFQSDDNPDIFTNPLPTGVQLQLQSVETVKSDNDLDQPSSDDVPHYDENSWDDQTGAIFTSRYRMNAIPLNHYPGISSRANSRRPGLTNFGDELLEFQEGYRERLGISRSSDELHFLPVPVDHRSSTNFLDGSLGTPHAKRFKTDS